MIVMSEKVYSGIMTVIDDLRAALVGKTVEKIDDSYRPGVICQIHCSQGERTSSFMLSIGEHKLHVLSADVKSIDDLFEAVSDYRMYASHSQCGVDVGSLPQSVVEITDDEITIDAFDGTKFSMRREFLKPGWQTTVFSHSEAALFVPDLIDLGSMWPIAFRRGAVSNGIPDVLLVDY